MLNPENSGQRKFGVRGYVRRPSPSNLKDSTIDNSAQNDFSHIPTSLTRRQNVSDTKPSQLSVPTTQEDDISIPIPWSRHLAKGALAVGGLALSTVIATSFLQETPVVLSLGSKIILGTSALIAIGANIATHIMEFTAQNPHVVNGVVADANNTTINNGQSTPLGGALFFGGTTAALSGFGTSYERQKRRSWGNYDRGDNSSNTDSSGFPESTYTN